MTLTRCLLAMCLGTLVSFSQLDARQLAEPARSSDAVPRLIDYSGKVLDEQGKPITGIAGASFAIYKQEEGGAPLWIESQNITLDKAGHYTVQLGAAKPDGLPLSLFASGEARWLGMRVDGGEEQPRVLLLSVPYALKAADAQTLGGLPSSAFVLAAPPTNTDAPATGSAAISLSSATPQATSNVTTSGGTVNSLPLWTTATNVQSSVVTQTGTGTVAKVGIGTTTPATTLDVKGSATIRGNLSSPAIGAATATAGKNSQPITLTTSAFSSTSSTAVSKNFRWQAEPVGNNTASSSGTLNLLFGSGATAPAETGLKISSNGQITFASGQTFPGVGQGTITAVIPGTALTGGGGTGNVTLNVDTAKVPLLANPNMFSAKQTISKGDLVLGMGDIDVPATTSASVGVVNLGTFPFVHACCGSGSDNVFVGSSSGNFTNTSGGNTASGHLALHALTTGNNNTANGWASLASNTIGSDNTASGWRALIANTSGHDNTASGLNALLNNTTGFNNTANGMQALAANSTGNENTANGVFALSNNTTGSEDTAVGYEALFSNTTGSNNTALGFEAGTSPSFTTGSSNTFVGAFAGALSPTTLSNATAIGANAQVTASNSLVLGSIKGVNATNDTNVGIGTTAPTERLDLGNNGNVVIKTDPGNDTTASSVAYELIGRGAGGVPNKWSIYTAPVGGGFGVPANSLSIWQYPPNQNPGCCLQRFVILPATAGQTGSTVVIDGNGDAFFPGCINYNGGGLGTCSSDVRLKKNIRSYSAVLEKLVQLQPVSYNWRVDEFPQYHFARSRTSGLIAQDVEKVFPEMVSLDGNGFRRVKYGELPYLMLQAIRELKAENDHLRDQLKAEEERIQRLSGQTADREDERSEIAQLREEVERLAAMVKMTSAREFEFKATRASAAETRQK